MRLEAHTQSGLPREEVVVPSSCIQSYPSQTPPLTEMLHPGHCWGQKHQLGGKRPQGSWGGDGLEPAALTHFPLLV